MGFLDFLGSIGDIFGEIASLISELFAFLWSYVYAALVFIWNTLIAVFNFLLSVFQNVGKFLARAWTDFIKPAINSIINFIAKIYSAIHRVLDPLLRWIQKIRKWYDTHILPILMRQLQMIQKVRRFLAILRIFHVKWAQQLDDKLAGIQSKITDTISVVRGYFNLIIDWIALICDETNVIRRSVLGSWLVSNLGGLKRIVGYGDGRQVTNSEQAAMDKARNRYTSANVHDHVQTLAMTGLTTDDMADREAARTALAEATGTPLPF
jgi:hypothetical protein